MSQTSSVEVIGHFTKNIEIEGRAETDRNAFCFIGH